MNQDEPQCPSESDHDMTDTTSTGSCRLHRQRHADAAFPELASELLRPFDDPEFGAIGVAIEIDTVRECWSFIFSFDAVLRCP